MCLGEIRMMQRTLVTVSTIVCGLAVLNTHANPSVPDQTLVLHYTFDQDTGDLATDHSEYHNDGKVIDAEYLEEFDGRRGVLRFDGGSAYINCGNSESLHFDGDMTIELWVRQNGPIQANYAYLFVENPPEIYSGR